MIVTRDTGIIVLCGELIRSDFDVDKDSSMQATYYIRTRGTNWTDPTGANGARDVNWTVWAWSAAATAANPDFPFLKRKHIAIEGIPTTETTATPRLLPHTPRLRGAASVGCGAEFWRTPTGRPKKAIKLRALFAIPVDDDDAERLANRVTWHPPGTKYWPWWRPADNIPDDDPSLLPETVHLSGEEDWGIGFQDDMRADYEFFYDDERWSRDP